MKARDVMIHFECGREDRWSEDLGPFPFVQMTYNVLRVGHDGERELAHYDVEKDDWIDEQGVAWSDVIICGV